MGKNVTQCLNAWQPKGGYLSPKQFVEYSIGDGAPNPQQSENISPALVGMAVDHLSLMAGEVTFEMAFNDSLKGYSGWKRWWESKNEYDENYDFQPEINLLKKIGSKKWWTSQDEDEITKIVWSAIRLVQMNQFHCRRPNYIQLNKLTPNQETVLNIKTMVGQMEQFIHKFGKITNGLPTFCVGYTEKIEGGEGDFLTADTLWDFKTSVGTINQRQTLQILLYWILSWHARRERDWKMRRQMTKLGIYNPRQGKAFVVNIKDIPMENIKQIEKLIMGYPDDMADSAIHFWDK